MNKTLAMRNLIYSLRDTYIIATAFDIIITIVGISLGIGEEGNPLGIPLVFVVAFAYMMFVAAAPMIIYRHIRIPWERHFAMFVFILLCVRDSAMHIAGGLSWIYVAFGWA